LRDDYFILSQSVRLTDKQSNRWTVKKTLHCMQSHGTVGFFKYGNLTSHVVNVKPLTGIWYKILCSNRSGRQIL